MMAKKAKRAKAKVLKRFYVAMPTGGLRYHYDSRRTEFATRAAAERAAMEASKSYPLESVVIWEMIGVKKGRVIALRFETDSAGEIRIDPIPSARTSRALSRSRHPSSTARGEPWQAKVRRI